MCQKSQRLNPLEVTNSFPRVPFDISSNTRYAHGGGRKNRQIGRLSQSMSDPPVCNGVALGGNIETLKKQSGDEQFGTSASRRFLKE